MDQNGRLGPVSGSARIRQVDILRGVALLGILIINIEYFAYPEETLFDPSRIGGFEGLDFWVWRLKTWFFSQKMMSIFSMLFGAGLILMAARAEEAGKPFRKIYYRRTLLLIVFGLMHAYLLWFGDILFAYGVCGLVIYLFRRKSPRTLVIIAVVSFLIGAVIMLGAGNMINFMRNTAEEATELTAQGEELSSLQASMMEAWSEIKVEFNPTQDKLQKSIEIYGNGSFVEIFKKRAVQSLTMQTQAFLFMILWQVLGLMLLGMALLKAKVITGERSIRFYTIQAVIGLSVGLGLSILAAEMQIGGGFDMIDYFRGGGPIMMFASAVAAIGYIGLIMLISKTDTRGFIKDRLAAVGRMALTNYLLQSIVCTTIFYSYGLGLFGEVNRAPAMLIVFGVWIIQLLYSKWWLERYKFGPVEWLWRSLTYGKKQPFKQATA